MSMEFIIRTTSGFYSSGYGDYEDAQLYADEIQERTGLECAVIVRTNVQREGIDSVFDCYEIRARVSSLEELMRALNRCSEQFILCGCQEGDLAGEIEIYDDYRE